MFLSAGSLPKGWARPELGASSSVEVSRGEKRPRNPGRLCLPWQETRLGAEQPGLELVVLGFGLLTGGCEAIPGSDPLGLAPLLAGCAAQFP